MANVKQIPKVKTPTLFLLYKLKKNFFKTISELANSYGDLYSFSMIKYLEIVANRPEFLKHIYEDNQSNYVKGYNSDIYLTSSLKFVFGDSIFSTDNNEKAIKDRKIVSSNLQMGKLSDYENLFRDNCASMLKEWETSCNNHKAIDLSLEFSTLTLKNLLTTLFNEKNFDFNKCNQLIRSVSEQIIKRAFSALQLNWILPTPARKKWRQSLSSLRELSTSLVENRLHDNKIINKSDLLSDFLEGYKELDKKLTIQKVSDEVSTMLIAGHETTASLLTWSMITLCQFPEIEMRLHEEIDNNVTDLPYMHAFLSEVLRLYPPAYSLPRIAINNDIIEGYTIPKDAEVSIQSYILHRNPAYWENPNTFNPERFLNSPWGQSNQYAYMPFGVGPRSCIGRQFAFREAIITLVMILQKYRFRLPKDLDLTPAPGVTLWPTSNVELDIFFK